jgi:ParB-like chromosome segregation protein Spo0J
MSASELTMEYRPIGDLRTFHMNPRRGNVAAIAASLRVNGQYRPIVVNVGTHTGRPDEVLAGNHTLMAARDLGWERLAVVLVDVDDDQAARIVAADNRTADLGDGYDDRTLAELLGGLDDLDGTGYTEDDLDKIVRDLDGAPGSADLLNADDAEDRYENRFGVIVECPDESAQQETYERLRDEGYTCRVVTV